MVFRVILINSNVDLDLVDNLAWAAGWRLLASSLAGPEKYFRIEPRGDKIAVCFGRQEMALSFIWQCAPHGIECSGSIEEI